jgi:hypothetical protein
MLRLFQVGKGRLALFPLHGLVRDRRHICMGWKGATVSPRLELRLLGDFRAKNP